MAASDHLNNYIKAYHISWNDTPPHEVAPSNLQDYQEDENVHPEVLHMGTRRAAVQIHRTHLHEYEIDPSVLHPVVHGDSEAMRGQSSVEGWRKEKVDKAMSGIQSELWEDISGNPVDVVRTGQVFPYRNLAEDAGSISFMVPKSAIRSGAVRYRGVTDLTAKDAEGRDTRDKIEEEEKMYKYAKPTEK